MLNYLLLLLTDNPSSGSPTFTAFQTFANGTYKGRGFKFKTELTSGDPAQNIRISQLGYTATLLRRVEQSNLLTANGSTNVTFTNSFFVGTSSLLGANSNLPSIGITAQDLDAGEFFQISNVSGTGFTIVFKDSSNNPVNGKHFTYQAVGFGKG